MGSGRCPHHVRHSTFDRKNQKMIFRDHCGLLVKKAHPQSTLKNRKTRSAQKPNRSGATSNQLSSNTDMQCTELPFPDHFNYMECPTYQSIFKSGATKNNAVPTHHMQYTSHGLTDLDIL